MLRPGGLCTVTSSFRVRLWPANTSANHSAEAGLAVASTPRTISAITRFIADPLFRLDLRNGGRAARDGGAAHVARLALVVAARAVHHLAVVPHDQIPHAPLVRVDELRLRGVLGEVLQENARLRHRHPDDAARVRRKVERLAAG